MYNINRIKKDWEDDRDHVWKLDIYGDIDFFAYDDEFHNGPQCEKCYYVFCHHCQDGPGTDCPVKTDGEIK